jgi:UDP-glucose 4-epimerase
MKPRIAVIGANGYLAKHVAKELFHLHYDDTILVDLHPPAHFESARHLQWDVREKNASVIDALKDCRYIFFFAGLTGTVQSIDRYSDFVETNEIGLLNLLEALRRSGLTSKVIFPSTRLVYRGKKDTLLKEGDVKECKTIYAMNKLACETYLRINHECFGTQYTVFRICVPYGNEFGQSLSYGSIRHFFLQAREKKNVVVYGDGSQKRTFTHVSDIARIVISGGLDERTDNEIFNIGGPDQLAIVDVATKIAAKYGVEVVFRDWTPLDSKTESGDTMFDSSKLNAIIPPDYEHSFDEWINSNPDVDR